MVELCWLVVNASALPACELDLRLFLMADQWTSSRLGVSNGSAARITAIPTVLQISHEHE